MQSSSFLNTSSGSFLVAIVLAVVGVILFLHANEANNEIIDNEVREILRPRDMETSKQMKKWHPDPRLMPVASAFYGYIFLVTAIIIAITGIIQLIFFDK